MVQFRWVKSKPTLAREVHLISSLVSTKLVTFFSVFKLTYFQKEDIETPKTIERNRHFEKKCCVTGPAIVKKPFMTNVIISCLAYHALSFQIYSLCCFWKQLLYSIAKCSLDEFPIFLRLNQSTLHGVELRNVFCHNLQMFPQAYTAVSLL